MPGDLLRAALRRDVLGAGERGAAALAGEAQQVLGDLRDGASRALLPRGVGGRVDHHLADDPPARVVGFTAADEEVRQRLGEGDRAGLRAVAVEVAQGRADAATVPDRPRQLQRAASGPAC